MVHTRTGKEKNKQADKPTHPGSKIKGKQVVAGLRNREGEVRLMEAVGSAKATLQNFACRKGAAGSTLYTDEHRSYTGLDHPYNHQSIYHSVDEEVAVVVQTNVIENFWAILKRGYLECSITATRCCGAHGVSHGEGQALVLEVLFYMGE